MSIIKDHMKNEETQGFKKMLEYYREVLDQDDFKNAVKIIRNKYVPKNLIEHYEELDSKYIMNRSFFDGYGFYYKLIYDKDISKDIREMILDRYHLDSSFEIDLYSIIFGASRPGKNISDDIDTCKIFEFKKTQKPLVEFYRKFYPLAIKISPYASERDILDFVKKNYIKIIKPLQQKYKAGNIKIGLIKSKKEEIRKRNHIIFSLYLQGNSSEKIKKVLIKTYKDKFLDNNEINKIISLEKKRRKEL